MFGVADVGGGYRLLTGVNPSFEGFDTSDRFSPIGADGPSNASLISNRG